MASMRKRRFGGLASMGSGGRLRGAGRGSIAGRGRGRRRAAGIAEFGVWKRRGGDEKKDPPNLRRLERGGGGLFPRIWGFSYKKLCRLENRQAEGDGWRGGTSAPP